MSESLRIVHLDELTQICGFFTSETNVNNGYGCTHPCQENTDTDYETNKPHGKCYPFSCPIANEADLEDLEQLDIDLYNEWKDKEHEPSHYGADLMVTDL